MSEAIFGLLGVLVGAFAQAAGTWWMAHRNERIATRAAARLTSGELMRGFLSLNAALEEGVWGPILDYPLSRVRWSENEAIFAAKLSNSMWLATYNAYRDFEKVHDWCTGRYEDESPLDEHDRERLEAASERAMEAAAALFAVALYGPGFSFRRFAYRTKSRLRPPSEDELMEDLGGVIHD